MSTTTTVVLIFLGIAALFSITYVNHLLEKNKLEKARRKAELVDRYRRCANLSNALPGQLMSTDLKQLLNRLELHFIEQLKVLDSHEPSYALRAEELRQWIAKADDLPIKNPHLNITTDEQTKDVRFQLESLQAQIVRAAEEKVLSITQGKQWLSQIKHMLVVVYIEYFNNVGRQQLANNCPNQARLVFERAIQYLKKQQDNALYKQNLIEFTALFEQADTMMLEQSGLKAQNICELTDGLAMQNQDEDDWKKKQIYD